jgi:bacterioferritin (cytochrome b1)
MINQIAPWDYLGSDRIIEPSEVRMKNAERYQERLLFELDCHPLVTQEAVEYAGKLIKDYCSRWK